MKALTGSHYFGPPAGGNILCEPASRLGPVPRIFPGPSSLDRVSNLETDRS